MKLSVLSSGSIRGVLAALATIGLASGVLWALGGMSDGMAAESAARAQAATATATLVPGECRASVDKWTDKTEVRLGDTVELFLSFRAECAEPRYPLHVVIAFDVSDSVDDRVRADVRDAVLTLIPCVFHPAVPDVKVALVEFATNSRTCPFTSSVDDSERCVKRSRPGAGRRTDRAIQEAQELFVRERGRAGVPADYIKEVIVVVAAGPNDAGCDATLRAAAHAKDAGILLMTMAAGRTAQSVACLRQAATSPLYYFDDGHVSDACKVFEPIRTDGLGTRPARMVMITDTLPANMAFVEKPQAPQPPTYDAPNLVWLTNSIPTEGITVSASVRPLELGTHPTNAKAEAVWRDYRNRLGTIVLPVATIRVLPAPPTPTPTPSPRPQPTATGTPEPDTFRALLPEALVPGGA